MLALAAGPVGCRVGAGGEGIESQPNPGEVNNGTCGNFDRVDRVDHALEALLPRFKAPEDIDVEACPPALAHCAHLRSGLRNSAQTALDPVKVAAFQRFVAAIAPELLFQVTRPDRADLFKCTDKPAEAVDGIVPWWTVPGRDTVTWVQDIGLLPTVPSTTVIKARSHELGHHVEYPIGSGVYVSDLGIFEGFEGRELLDLLASYFLYRLNESGLFPPEPTPTPIVIRETVVAASPPGRMEDANPVEHVAGRAVRIGTCAGLTVQLINRGEGPVRSLANHELGYGWVYQSNAPLGGGTCATPGREWKTGESCTVGLAFCPSTPGPVRAPMNIARYSDRTGTIRSSWASLYAVATQPVYAHMNTSTYSIVYTWSQAPLPGYAPPVPAGYSVWAEPSVCNIPIYQCFKPLSPTNVPTLQTMDPNCNGWNRLGMMGYVCANPPEPNLQQVFLFTNGRGNYYTGTAAVPGWVSIGAFGWAGR